MISKRLLRNQARLLLAYPIQMTGTEIMVKLSNIRVINKRPQNKKI